MPAIGKWRPAGVLRDGWQILKIDQFEQTGVEEWLTIERAIQITAPLRVVSLKMSDGDSYGCPADKASGYEFFTRTQAEAQRVAEQDRCNADRPIEHTITDAGRSFLTLRTA